MSLEPIKGHSPTNRYYIQYAGCCGDCVLFWRPERRGYTTRVDQAGVYTLEETQDICEMRDTEQAWPAETVQAAACLMVEVGRLRDFMRDQGGDHV